MDILKKAFPLSFKKTKGVGELIINILIYLLVGIAAGALIWLASMLTGWIPVVGALIGWLVGIIGALVDVYVVVGIVISILVFLKVLK